MRRIAHLTVLFSLLVLPACAPYQSPFANVMHCPDYPTPELQLQCQTMVLGLYQSGQNAMFSRWNAATHVEPVQSGYQPVPVRPLSQPAPTTCNVVGSMVFCQ